MSILWDITFFHNTKMAPLFPRLKIIETGIFCNTECYPYNFVQHCEAKNFSTEKSDMSFFCIKMSDTRSNLKHWRVPHEYFFALWDKKSSLEVDENLFFCTKSSAKRSFLKHWRVLPPIFWHCGTKKIRRKKVKSAIFHPYFCFIIEIIWNTERTPSVSFGFCGTKIFR